ncbi:conserved hypothetical protein [Neospora caninum Liverpool]|uniref:Uncharacterized protein n=1 Tax=Neospora caninum (strain Liverpool) TaxID=572307 RepID=F0VRK9_NEOCL|nr:conserved hypothetical protein [Neospora caninum Liverpool]CBZ56357.1 conserved hypothetical protein [Neospora caninum Liverpool]CEL71117.1 TPA: hypothetical protein BN1204_067810 [Neospora caninum Liverpool]|eukprot:XP_003886382.1 conserved hypothetical protein [Neospora caninum Liverpool]
MSARMFTKLCFLLLVGQAVILRCTAAEDDASGEKSPHFSNTEKMAIEVVPVKRTSEQEDTVPSASNDEMGLSDDKSRSGVGEDPTTIAGLEQPCASSVSSRTHTDSDGNETHTMKEKRNSVSTEKDQRRRSSGRSFLAPKDMSLRSPVYTTLPFPASLEVMQSVLASLWQPVPLFYFLLPLDGELQTEKKASTARQRKSDHLTNEEIPPSGDGKLAGQPQKQTQEDGTKGANLSVGQEAAPASQQSQPSGTISATSEGHESENEETRRSRSSNRRGSASSSSRHSSYPYYRGDRYDPVRDYLAASLASQYYSGNAFFPLPYYQYVPLSMAPYEAADIMASMYFYGDREHAGGRDLQDQRDHEYFPSIHTGDHTGIHQRPSRHEYEHRQYGSRYNHGMDRFFY